MTNITKFRLFKSLNFFFRIGVPIIAAAAIWGVFKAPDPNATTGSILSQIGGGVFVAGIVLIFEGQTYVKKQIEQMKLDTKTVIAKNHTVLYTALGLFLLAVTLFAAQAMVFCFVSAGGNAVAAALELKENKYRRLAYPIK